MIFHDVPHIFRANRGTGTTIMQLNMAQEIASIDQDPLLMVLLDLSKEYETLDRGRIIQTLEGDREGPNMRGILAEFL